MPVLYPTALDSTSSTSFGSDVRNNTTTIVEGHINDLRNAIKALEAKTGVDYSTVNASLDAKIRALPIKMTPRKGAVIFEVGCSSHDVWPAKDVWYPSTGLLVDYDTDYYIPSSTDTEYRGIQLTKDTTTKRYTEALNYDFTAGQDFRSGGNPPILGVWLYIHPDLLGDRVTTGINSIIISVTDNGSEKTFEHIITRAGWNFVAASLGEFSGGGLTGESVTKIEIRFYLIDTEASKLLTGLVATVCKVQFFAPPTKGIYCLTIDDGLEQNMVLAEKLRQKGIPTTFFVNGSTIGGASKMSEYHLRELVAMGHCVANHGYIHYPVGSDTPDATHLPTAEKAEIYRKNIIDNIEFLHSVGIGNSAHIYAPGGGTPFTLYSDYVDLWNDCTLIRGGTGLPNTTILHPQQWIGSKSAGSAADFASHLTQCELKTGLISVITHGTSDGWSLAEFDTAITNIKTSVDNGDIECMTYQTLLEG